MRSQIHKSTFSTFQIEFETFKPADNQRKVSRLVRQPFKQNQTAHIIANPITN